MKLISVVLLLIVSAVNAVAGQEEHPLDTSDIHTGRLVIIGTLTAGTVALVHIYQQQAWWQGQRAPFRFENDWDYALNIDKFGHAYGAYVLSHLFTYALTWSGFESRASVFYGSAFGLLYQLYVEVEDGFHKDYGFSPGDAFSDVIGASIPLAQEAFPVLRNLSLKWSYFPSSEYIDALKQKQSRVFIDDYQGQIYWLGMDPHFLMSDAWAKSIPAWLGISLGAAVRNLDGSGGGTKQFYLALDYNLSKIETDSPFLRGLFIALDHFHLPAPAIYLDGKALKAGVVY